jgi:hypothetical protein
MRPTAPPARAALNLRLVRVSTLAILAATSVAVASAPASANPAGPTKPVNLTEGINRSAHSVTTHDGTVITGITFIDAADTGTFIQQRATSASQLAVATGGTLTCYSQWRYITAGGPNTYWKADSSAFPIYANGNRNADYWYQQFLPCYYPGWELNAWAFLSNGTGEFVNRNRPTIDLYANIPATLSEADFTYYTKLFVCTFDGNWISILLDRYASQNAWAYRNPGTGRMEKSWGSLNGNNLFKVDPTVLTGGCQS